MATNQGLLQAQIKVKNTIDLNNAFSSPSVANPQLKSIEGELNLSNEYALQSFNSSNTNTQHIDTIRTNSSNTSLKEALNNLPNLKYVRLEGSYESKGNSFDNNTSLQKVDLSESLQVKPEDFKANESLKTLPNLDYSNPDLTDIITNDTNLKSTTIDLSNQNNTTKLGIHGDSTHQLRNLEFVKVNPEAPFDNQITPQIDVSYTSLDRNGLVNLFNTMPYNVGYQIIGSPTIVDGVASGFSSSDYVKTEDNLPSNITSLQIHTEAIKANSPSVTYGIFMINGYPSIEFRGNMFRIYVLNQDGTSTPYGYQGESVNANEKVLVDMYWKNGTTRFVAVQNGVTVLDKSYQNTKISSGYVGFGWRWNPLNGSIDLNETYIKVNDVPWFTGKAAMTKTCDVRGCTGTADLTAEDKAIATAKGWTLVTE